MDLPTLGTLVLLALADSTSFGTLLIPIWLLLASGRPRPGRMLAYLGTVASFYLVVGIALSLGASLLLDGVQSWLETPAGGMLVGGAGAVLLVGAIVFGTRKGKESGSSGRLLRWRERVMGEEATSIRPLIGLALTATAIEVATLLPYLMAIGIMDAADLDPLVHGGVLAAYCLVMVLPALVLLVLRLVAHAAIEPLLRRINDWLMRSAGEMTVWIVGIIGVLLIRTGAEQLGGLDALLQQLLGSVGLR